MMMLKRVLKMVLAVVAVSVLLIGGLVAFIVVNETSEKRAARDGAYAAAAPARAAAVEAAAAERAEIRKRINEAMERTLTEAGVTGSWTWEQASGGWLVVTVEIPEDDGYKARTIGTKGVLAVRNQFYQQKIAGMDSDRYRVTVNGPSPGPDMIKRYGSARLNGGEVNWESGLRR
jgi:hypothetical protein